MRFLFPFLAGDSKFELHSGKYLYLLFDVDNPINKRGERFLFTTEGHVFPIERSSWKVWEEDEEDALFSRKVLFLFKSRVPSYCFPGFCNS